MNPEHPHEFALKCTLNHLLRTEQCWPLQVITLSEYLFKGHYRKFAHLYVLSIRSFDCMVLRSFPTPSQCDFRSNVICPQNVKMAKMQWHLHYVDLNKTL